MLFWSNERRSVSGCDRNDLEREWRAFKSQSILKQVFSILALPVLSGSSHMCHSCSKWAKINTEKLKKTWEHLKILFPFKFVCILCLLVLWHTRTPNKVSLGTHFHWKENTEQTQKTRDSVHKRSVQTQAMYIMCYKVENCNFHTTDSKIGLIFPENIYYWSF